MTIFDRAEATQPAAKITASLANARSLPYWLDSPERPDALPQLRRSVTADLAIVGGGYTGLWTALLAKERDPQRRVVILEAESVGWAASGRNGGFCEPSLTHGKSNGLSHLPKEFDQLQRLGIENVHEIAAAVERYGMDCDFEFSGVLRVATEPHQVDWLRAEATDADHVFFDADQVREQVNSPTYLAGFWEKTHNAMVNPAKLVWELRRVVLELGVEIYENTPVTALDSDVDVVTLHTPLGRVMADRVALATNAFPALIKRMRPFTVPVYDFALMTEPLTAAQEAAIGWDDRQGIADMANQFHYYRTTRDADGRLRILFGGYDAVYHYGGKIRAERMQNDATFRKLSAHFYETFPQLSDVRFSHKWGGVVDTCSRFFSFFSTAHRGKVAYAAGFTGLGVAATRFGANVMLDLLSGVSTERTQLDLVKKKPIPFPPEPIRWLGVWITTKERDRADRNGGKRGLWLKIMDAVGMGFDS